LAHRALYRWLASLNRCYRDEPALHEGDCDPAGFEWIDANDLECSVLSFLRKARTRDEVVMVVCNFTPVPRFNYRVGAPRPGFWQEILNSDATEHGGSGHGNLGGVEASPIPFHGRPFSLNVMLPPLAAVFFKHEPNPAC
jgi:1,4-alpha-glucan branching enzyme